MAQINPHINFNGNAEEAFNFYKTVFGGEFSKIIRFKDIASEEFPVPEKEAHKLMHIALPISRETCLMGSDVGGEWAKHIADGNNIQISINAESEAEASRIFNGLSEGGRVNMPLAKTFWGAFFGMFTDKFGINWMVNYDYNQANK